MPNWRNKIQIKQYLNDNESDEYVAEICGHIIFQLVLVLNRERKINKNRVEEYILAELEEIINEFKWVKESAESKIDASKFTYDSWCQAFNEWLDSLYDLGDISITARDIYNNEKFLWVG